MTQPAFFGYGSLVNLATHSYAAARPARLTGWRRIWRHATLRDAAFLSVEPATGAMIDGVVAVVPGADWTALDLREAAYDRHDVSGSVQHGGPATQTAIYQVNPRYLAAAGQNCPILRSYLDVVVQGYFQVYGASGVADFFATTSGWDMPILDDRHAPLYPRHQRLSAAETALVDHHLAKVTT